jgi:exonuclease SbcD
VRRPEDGGVITVRSRAGEVARVGLLPFLSQRSVVKAEQLMALDAGQHASHYAERCKLIISRMAEQFSGDTINLLLGHLTVTGGEPVLGGGERAAHTIFDYFVTPQSFPSSAHYVALGHLHLPHRIPGPAPLWYAGAPLALDFGEAERDHKAVLLIDVAPDTPAQVREIALASGRRLRTLRGTLDELVSRREQVDPDAYLRVVLDEPPRSGLARLVRDEFPQAVDVSINPQVDDTRRQVEPHDMHGSPQELFGRYLAEHGGRDTAVEALFARLLEEEHATDAS